MTKAEKKARGLAAVAELKMRRQQWHQPGCACQTKTPMGPGRLAGGCAQLLRMACAAGLWQEVQ